MRLAFVLMLMAAPACAESPLTADEFAKIVTGRAFAHSFPPDPPYATEEYLPNNRARWVTVDGTCMYGTYFQSDSYICFKYDNGDTPCWHYFADGPGLIARFSENGDDPSGDIMMRDAPPPLACAGPDVGA